MCRKWSGNEYEWGLARGERRVRAGEWGPDHLSQHGDSEPRHGDTERHSGIRGRGTQRAALVWTGGPWLIRQDHQSRREMKLWTIIYVDIEYLKNHTLLLCILYTCRCTKSAKQGYFHSDVLIGKDFPRTFDISTYICTFIYISVPLL